LQPLEIAGTILGLLNLWLTIRQNIWCWPVGIACVICFGVVFFEARLYSDVLLQVVYVVMQLYGWWFWIAKGHIGAHSTFAINSLDLLQLARWGAVVIIGWLVLGTGMANFTKADLPYVDALPTSMSMVAAWLQARKILQSWLFFILGNLLFIGLYAMKGLHVTIVLYVVSTALAVFGYLNWAKMARGRQSIVNQSSTNC
jgi:nicotinamide mononucleotide transporter